MKDYTIRQASISDLETIVSHRRNMIKEIRDCSNEALDEMSKDFRLWLHRMMSTGDYVGFFAVAEDETVASGVGIWIMDWPPHVLPSERTGTKRAYLLNVYSEPRHRMKGLSRALVQKAIEWCVANDLNVVSLHASKFGKHLYESLKFEPTNEMRMYLA